MNKTFVKVNEIWKTFNFFFQNVQQYLLPKNIKFI